MFQVSNFDPTVELLCQLYSTWYTDRLTISYNHMTMDFLEITFK